MRILRILIIEDHEPTRDALRSIQRRKGFEVEIAGTICEGMGILGSSWVPDCLVLDLDLPDGHGETVLRAIRDGHLPIRVAVCSGMADLSRWEPVRHLDPEAILQKPIQVADVCKACEAVWDV